jgi:hypothetical protein
LISGVDVFSTEAGIVIKALRTSQKAGPEGIAAVVKVLAG